MFCIVTIALFCVCRNVAAQNLMSQYQAYVNYSVAAFDNSAPSIVPTVNDCLMYSTVAPATNGVMYNDFNKNCIVLTTNNNEILLALHSNLGWVTYVKDISQVQRLVFKAQAGQSSVVTGQYLGSAFLNQRSAIFTSNYTAAVGSFNKSASCGCTYRNPIIDNWDVTQVQVDVYKDRLPVARYVYDGTDRSNSGWFSKNLTLTAIPYNFQTFKKASFAAFGLLLQLVMLAEHKHAIWSSPWLLILLIRRRATMQST